MISKLPDLPSDLITLALNDLEKCRAMPQIYTIDMEVWHDGMGEYHKCEVCLAGAVMAQTLQTPLHVSIDPSNCAFAVADSNKLLALNGFRGGAIRYGVSFMGIEPLPKSIKGFYGITPYEDDPAAFIKDMRALAADLAKHGL